MDGVLRRLPREFFARHAPLVAADLIGKILVHGSVSGRIVECEAYDRHDPACHSFRGMTPRNATMFGPPGHAYVYFTYGMHWCANVVTGDHTGEAVLLRAVEPITGIPTMARRRGVSRRALRDLARGPARLTQSFGLDRRHDALDLCTSRLGIYADEPRTFAIETGPRIGITRGVRTPWRFVMAGSRFACPPPRRR